jgi:hypothetical protein
MVSSRVYPSLERKKGGPDNWVERTGGLPDFIERVAKHLHYEEGMSISRAIATAVSQCKKWCAKGNAKACKAIAQWEGKKARARAATGKTKKLTDMEYIELAYGESAAATKTSRFDETKHVRSPIDGKFSEKFTPSQLLAARRIVEAGIANLQEGDTFNIPGNVGWVQRTAAGYIVQGPAGVRFTARVASDAVSAAAQILAGKIGELENRESR